MKFILRTVLVKLLIKKLLNNNDNSNTNNKNLFKLHFIVISLNLQIQISLYGNLYLAGLQRKYILNTNTNT